jgi:hypothetical protein
MQGYADWMSGRFVIVPLGGTGGMIGTQAEVARKSAVSQSNGMGSLMRQVVRESVNWVIVACRWDMHGVRRRR